MRALFKGAKLEVESIIRDVSEKVLYDQDISKRTQRLRAEALEWATTRGSRSGRTAFQYIQDLAGRLGQTMD